VSDVAHLRAEDETGVFGILPSHADFLTVLAPAVASWRDDRGAEHHVALRGGLLEVHGGDAIAIATPEAVAGDDLHRLESEVLPDFAASSPRSRQPVQTRSASIWPRSVRSRAFSAPKELRQIP
jgi:alternate F1F0 ATPase F1 subunit epsilon